MKKILFLDCDGVLNTWVTLSALGDPDFHIDASKVALVNEICATTGAEVVISSDWRFGMPHPAFSDHLRKHFGATFTVLGEVDQRTGARINLISEWLDNNVFEDATFVILDDLDVFLGAPEALQRLRDKFLFRTDPKVGLTREIADKIVERLGKN